MNEEPVVKPLVNRKKTVIHRCHMLSQEIYRREAKKRKIRGENGE